VYTVAPVDRNLKQGPYFRFWLECKVISKLKEIFERNTFIGWCHSHVILKIQPNSTLFYLAYSFRKKVEVGAVFKINSLENMTKFKKNMKKIPQNFAKLCQI